MGMNSWPVGADVTGFLNDSGFADLPTVDFGELVDRAVSELEMMVGFGPFLAGSMAEFRFDSMSGVVLLDRPFGLISGVECGGESVQFTTCPEGVLPVRKLALADNLSGAVVVSGRPGFGVEIPADIWYAVRDLAASYVVAMLEAASNDDVESVKQDSVTIKYRAGISPARFAELLSDRSLVVFGRYRVPGLGA
ncbi:hypothetical protein C0431_00130 [bacterium]|nr:hypothetical protein [bacterium]